MAVDMFLKLDDVKGESQDDKHKEDIDVLAWSWGMSQSGSFHLGSGGGAGKVNVQDISVTKYVDKSSATLMMFCATGKHFDKGSLFVRKAGGDDPLEYIVIDMKKVLVTSVSTGGSPAEERLTENISLNFAEVDYKYTVQKEGGGAGEEMPFGFNIASNKPK